MTTTADFFVTSDVEVSTFDSWSVGEIQYLIDKLSGVTTQAAISSARAIALFPTIRQGDLSILLEAKARKSEIRVITPFNVEEFLRQHGYTAERYIDGVGDKAHVVADFSNGEDTVILHQYAGILQVPAQFKIKDVEMPRIVGNPLFARIASLLASFVRVDNSNTEMKGTCISSIQFLSFTQCGMKTELSDTSINTVLAHSFFKGFPICNSLELAHYFVLRLADMSRAQAVIFIQLVLTRLFPSLFVGQRLNKIMLHKVAQMYKNSFVPYPPKVIEEVRAQFVTDHGIQFDATSPYLPQCLARGIPLVVGSIRNVTLDVILEFIPRARTARGENLEHSSAFTSDYVFGGFNTKRYIVSEVLAHIVELVKHDHKIIVVTSKKSLLEPVCAISKLAPEVKFYVVGPALNAKDKARFPNVNTLSVLHSCNNGLVIDMNLPELVSKGKRDSAAELLKDYASSIEDRVHYFKTLGAKNMILAARQYMPLAGLYSYSYFPHSLSGFYSTFDWLTLKSPFLHEVAPLVVKWTEIAEGVREFYVKCYRINKARTFYAMLLTGIDGLMAYPKTVVDGGGNTSYRMTYLTNFFREYRGETDSIEMMTPGQVSVMSEIETRDDDDLVHDEVVGGLEGVSLAVPQSTASTAPPVSSVVPSVQKPPVGTLISYSPGDIKSVVQPLPLIPGLAPYVPLVNTSSIPVTLKGSSSSLPKTAPKGGGDSLFDGEDEVLGGFGKDG